MLSYPYPLRVTWAKTQLPQLDALFVFVTTQTQEVQKVIQSNDSIAYYIVSF